MSKPKTPTHRALAIQRASGGSFVYCIPTGARCTIWAGKVPLNNWGAGAREGYSSPATPAGELPRGGQLRIYLGTKLIGFIPDVIEFYELDSVLIRAIGEVPPSLGQIQGQDEKKFLTETTQAFNFGSQGVQVK